MQLHLGLAGLNLAASCVSIGNFDGVHLGHQAIVARLVAQAKALALPSVLVIFEPQPLEFFAGAQAPARLMTLRLKYQALQALGLDHLLVLKFNAGLAQLSGQQFIEQILIQGLAVRYLLVGDDFRFGHKRSGDFSLLQQAAVRFGFQLQATESILTHGLRVSSTLIRQALAEHDLALAAQCLGRPYRLSGKVCYGQQLGRQLGVPTANISLPRLPPCTGVFAVQAQTPDGQAWSGIANLGPKPTLGVQKHSLEVHLFGQVGNLYGQRLTVALLQSIRQVQAFASITELKAQIDTDLHKAHAIFNGNSKS